ncbi:MAG: alpha/beta hydrolase [Candidatus Eisenbacteria bacterium]|nr:alpha/beta hydrolase [Candidatus Eisenbacteria bacterium]
MTTQASVAPLDRAPAPETPFFFPSGDRPLYAVHHAPVAGRANAPVVVHCHSLGVEQVTCYRAEVLCARAAAAAGFPVLRYHARGHGDSAGDFADATLARLIEDALAAAREALRRSGATHVIWLGVRFGALVAASALPLGPPAAGLALWEPVQSPRDYFRAQLRGLLYSQVAEGRKPTETVDDLFARLDRDGAVDVHGYYLHRALADSVRDVTLARRLETWNGPTFLAQIEQRRSLAPAHAALAEALAARGAKVETMRVPEEPGWHMVANPAWTSPELVAATAEWLRAVA